MTKVYYVYTMQSGEYIRFEWDSEKSFQNYFKHGLMFVDVLSVWEDELATEYYDDLYENERRYIRKGHNSAGCFVIIVFTERPPDVIRIISARLATLKERRKHER